MKAIRMLRIILLVVSILVETSSVANPLTLSGSETEIDITSHWQYARQNSASTSMEEMAKQPSLLEWKSLPDDLSSFATTTDTLWLRLELSHDGPVFDPLFVCFRFAELDLVDFLLHDSSGAVRTQETGIARPFHTSSLNFPRPCITFHLAAGKSTLYARLKSKGPLEITSALFTTEGFENYRDRNNLVTAFLLSFMLVILIQVCILAFAFRDRGLTLYAAHVFFMTFQVLALTGYLSHLFPDTPYLVRISKPLFGALALFLLFEVIRHFLNLRASHTFKARTTNVLRSVALAFVPVAFILHPAVDGIQALVSLVLIFGIIAVLVGDSRSNPVARLILAGFLFFLTSTVVEILTAFGVVRTNAFTEMVPHLGIMTESLFVGLAVTRYLSAMTRLLAQKNVELTELNRTLGREIEVRRQTELQLVEERQRAIENARFRSAAEIAGNLTHEINTPLSIISFTTQNLLHAFPPNQAESARPRAELEKILKTIERTTTIVRNMRLLSRESGREPPVRFPMKALFDDSIGLFTHRLEKEGIRIEQVIPDPMLFVRAQQAGVFQVVTNLIKNAIDALTGPDAPRERLITLEGKKENGEVVIAVTDNGPGIPTGNEEKIFEPFFTTKPGGIGHGLGLSISAKIARDHRGTLTLDRSSPRTRFVLRFPET